MEAGSYLEFSYHIDGYTNIVETGIKIENELAEDLLNLDTVIQREYIKKFIVGLLDDNGYYNLKEGKRIDISYFIHKTPTIH